MLGHTGSIDRKLSGLPDNVIELGGLGVALVNGPRSCCADLAFPRLRTGTTAGVCISLTRGLGSLHIVPCKRRRRAGKGERAQRKRGCKIFPGSDVFLHSHLPLAATQLAAPVRHYDWTAIRYLQSGLRCPYLGLLPSHRVRARFVRLISQALRWSERPSFP
jgi:hypothetical protein